MMMPKTVCQKPKYPNLTYQVCQEFPLFLALLQQETKSVLSQFILNESSTNVINQILYKTNMEWKT